MNLGQIVKISDDSGLDGKVGIVCNAKTFGATDGRVPVMFPYFVAPRWFLARELILASEEDKKKHFLEMLSGL